MDKLVVGRLYTVAEAEVLACDPAFCFWTPDGTLDSVQNVHLDDGRISACEGWDQVRFRFAGTNQEWIDEFYLDGTWGDVKDLLEVHEGHYGTRLLVPKGTLERARAAWPVTDTIPALTTV